MQHFLATRGSGRAPLSDEAQKDLNAIAKAVPNATLASLTKLHEALDAQVAGALSALLDPHATDKRVQTSLGHIERFCAAKETKKVGKELTLIRERLDLFGLTTERVEELIAQIGEDDETPAARKRSKKKDEDYAEGTRKKGRRAKKDEESDEVDGEGGGEKAEALLWLLRTLARHCPEIFTSTLPTLAPLVEDENEEVRRSLGLKDVCSGR